MSRVDEAMRRAGVGSPGADAETQDPGAESYPIEMPDRQRSLDLRPAPMPGSWTQDQKHMAPDPDPDVIRPVEPATPARETHRLFERFHPQVTEKTVIDRRMPAACREQYRRLAAVLHDAQSANNIKVVMVASAVSGEGKTLTAANIALTLSSSYRKRVLVIDGDLRRPVMHQIFRVDAASGLAEGLDPSTDAKIVVRQITPTLALLPAGRPTSDPMAALISDRMRRLVEEARATFDWVIIDTPPLVLLPDANLVSSIADAALLVVRAESTPHAMVKRAMEAIGSSRVLGVVLNQAENGPAGGYDPYGAAYYGVPATTVSS